MTIQKILLPSIKATWQTRWSWVIALLTLTPLTLQNEWKIVVDLASAIKNPREYFWLLSGFSAELFTLGDIIEAARTAPISFIILIVATVLIIILVLFFAWIIVHAQGVIILRNAPATAHSTKTLPEALNKIGRTWVPLLQLNTGMLISRLLAVSLLLLVVSILPSGTQNILWWFVFIPVLGIITAVSYIVRFAIFKVMLEKKDIKHALRDAWLLFKRNILSCYEFSFILYAFTFFVITIVLWLLFAVISPAEIGESIIAVLLLNVGIAPIIVGGAMLIIIAFVTGWLALLQYTAWLTWYAESSDGIRGHSYIERLYTFVRSYVK